MDHFSKLMMVVFLLVIFVVLPQSSGAQDSQVYESSPLLPVSWTELIFKGSKLMTRITVKIQVSSADLSAKSGNGLSECSEAVSANKLLTVQSSSKGMGASASKYEEKIWFNETTVRPDKRVRLSSGDAPWVKNYCWEDTGVRRQKIQPAKSSEKKHPPGKWTRNTESFYQYPPEVSRCEMISDPSVVFYLLSTLEFDRQEEPFEICVFGRKQLHRLTITLEQPSSLRVSYKARSLTEEVAVEDKIKPVVFAITTETFAPDKEKPEAYSFLGLNKDIRIYLDPEKRLPVRISGTNNSIGGLELDLKIFSKTATHLE